jgi:hypothetical protein
MLGIASDEALDRNVCRTNHVAYKRPAEEVRSRLENDVSALGLMAILEFIVLMLLGGHPRATGYCLERSVNAVIVVGKARVLLVMIDPGSGHLIFFIPL